MSPKSLRTCAALVAAGCVCVGATMSRAVGPDVIVGDLMDIDNYTPTAAVNGYRSYAVGTISCNMGTSTLQWIANTNRHPVISQNLFRLHNGRFEQVGMSWLKHGFTALQQTTCSNACVANPNGTALGVLCSDPYTASLNGSQNRLGPRSEVNAASAYYPYPFINTGQRATYDPQAILFKRVVVREVDLLSAGGQYFVSGAYVTGDDAEADNKHNNASYRRVTVGAAPAYNLTLMDTTQRQKAPIYAWRDHGLGANSPDPNVLITTNDLPNDSTFHASSPRAGQQTDARFIIGAKATDIGAGQWRYDYAVYNQNSDRSGATFSVPLPAGTVVDMGTTDATKAPYFHDVEYHSGEPYDPTDWAVAVSSGTVSWSCTQTHAQNVNANALRWDTMFTFSFVCNTPPTTGQATLGLFKPGDVPTMALNTLVPSPDGQIHPLNDGAAFAAPVGVGVVPFTTINSTTDGPAEPGCSISGGPQIDNDVWYRFTSTCTGTIRISTCGTGFDTKIAVYPNGSGVPGAGTAIACNDNDPLCNSGEPTGSTVQFGATTGTSYLLRIGGANGASGSGTMTISTPGCPGPQVPANDLQANAQWVSDGVAVNGSTTLATTDGSANCFATTGKDVWFKYRPQANGTITFSTCGSGFDTVLSVFYTNSQGTPLQACNDNAQSGPCPGTSQSYAAVVGIAGNEYLIRVAGKNTQSGNYQLLVSGGGGVLPPTNDTCATRQLVGVGSTNFSTINAGTDGAANALCNSNGTNQITGDIWYNFTAPATARYVIGTCGSTFDSRLGVYSGAGCNALDSRLLACSDNACGTSARVVLPTRAGSNYTLRLGGTNGATGTGTLAITPVACLADYDDGTGTGTPDGGVAIDDLLYYIGLFDAGSALADLDDGTGAGPDGGVDISDLLFYLVRFEAGC